VGRCDASLPFELEQGVVHALHHRRLAAAHGLVVGGLKLQGIVAPAFEDLALAGGGGDLLGRRDRDFQSGAEV
jgi:hypothetical protein